MGLFDFASDLGKKLFGSEEEAGDKLKEHVESDNPGVKDLQVQVEGGVAKVSGEAESPSAFEKAILMVGNALGISSVQAEEMTVQGEPAVEPAVEEVQYYVIQSGDSLWKISSEFYGNGAKYQAIFEANREVIKDPDLIYPGQKIRIPKQD